MSAKSRREATAAEALVIALDVLVAKAFGPSGHLEPFLRLAQERQKYQSKQEKPTIWYHGNQSYSIGDDIGVPVPDLEHAFLNAFLDKERGLSTRDLEQMGAGNVSKTA